MNWKLIIGTVLIIGVILRFTYDVFAFDFCDSKSGTVRVGNQIELIYMADCVDTFICKIGKDTVYSKKDIVGELYDVRDFKCIKRF